MVAVVRRRLGTRSVGHAGALDPFATGLLVVLVGRATRLARFVEGLPKRYRTVVRFGTATDTDDSTGTVVAEATPASWPDRDALEAIGAGFMGRQSQRPPAFSAKHVAGTRSYVLARQGRARALPDAIVSVHALTVTAWDPPDLSLELVVGRGTYVRALARDFGVRAGIPAHCGELRRTAIGPFDVADAVAPADVTGERVMAPAAMLPALPAETLDAVRGRDVGFGRAVVQQQRVDGDGALLDEDGRLLAAAEGRDGWWHPVVVLEPVQ